MDFTKMMEKAQAMQTQMAAMQKELERISVTGSAGAGLVSIVANGKGEVQSVRIDPSVVNPADIEMLEDLVAAAVKDTQNKAAKAAQQEMGKITGGLDLPFKLPF